MAKIKVLVYTITICAMLFGVSAQAVEQLHFGYQTTYPNMINAMKNSTRIGYVFWSLNQTGYGVPYCYHDGYVEWVGASKTAQQASDRWVSIRNGNGDPWTGASGATVGTPTIIVLDEISSTFADTAQGPALRSALNIHFTATGSRALIVGAIQRSLALISNPQNGSYDDLIYMINSRLRWASLETYCSHKGFITGTDMDGNVIGQTDDNYLAARLGAPIYRWALPCTSTRLKANLSPSLFGTYPGYAKAFYKFLNRQMWFIANGWYEGSHANVSANVKAVSRTGTDGYTWTPGTGTWQLVSSEVNRDTYFEKYIMWYCVGGNLNAHADGVDAR